LSYKVVSFSRIKSWSSVTTDEEDTE
jgi:hypothetical protein